MELHQLDEPGIGETERLVSARMSDSDNASASMAVNGSAAQRNHGAPADGAEGDFLCGVALSVYQNSGGTGTNWEAFENQRSLFFPNIAVRMPA